MRPAKMIQRTLSLLEGRYTQDQGDNFRILIATHSGENLRPPSYFTLYDPKKLLTTSVSTIQWYPKGINCKECVEIRLIPKSRKMVSSVRIVNESTVLSANETAFENAITAQWVIPIRKIYRQYMQLAHSVIDKEYTDKRHADNAEQHFRAISEFLPELVDDILLKADK